MNHYDTVIIGFGKAGKTLAPQIAATGKKVAIIEKSPLMYGGTCPNVGCIPSKALINSAKKINDLSPSWAERQKAYRTSIENKNQLTATLRNNMYQKMINAGVDVIDGQASFVDNKTIQIQTSHGKKEITSDKFFINTGAASFIPPIKGIENPNIYTSETLMNLPELPQTLAIVGGGYIGLEFASMYAGFGSKVVVFQDLPDFLPREDEDIAQAILSRLKDQRIEFHFGVKVEEFAIWGQQVEVKYLESERQNSLKADAVLIATGRRPEIKALKLENADVETTAFGAIKVNEKLQTTNPRIWAVGDVTGGLQFTYISLDDYRVIRNQLPLGGPTYTTDLRKNVPYSVFLDPPYSRIGLNEKEARTQNRNIKIATLPAAAISRAKATGENQGLLKAIIDSDSSEILGVMLFCTDSYELVNLIKLAMDNHLSYISLRDMIYTHPSMSEAFNDLFNI